jgi:pentatricopeptide repeat protein
VQANILHRLVQTGDVGKVVYFLREMLDKNPNADL